MSDFGTIKSRIDDELARDSTDAQLSNAVVGAIEFYKRQRFNFNMRRSTTPLRGGTEYYLLPTDFVEADTLVLDTGQNRYYLRERSFVWIDEQESPADYQTIPGSFAIQNYELRIYPIPDQSYTILLSYVYSMSDVSASASDGASNAWLQQGEELIRLHAKVDLLENKIRGPESFQEAQVLRSRENDVLSQLRREYKRAQSSGRVAADNF